MSFCDGSVQKINYSINVETHRRLGVRMFPGYTAGDHLPMPARSW